MILASSRLTLREAESRDVGELAGYQRDPRYLEARAANRVEHGTEPLDAARIVELARQWASERPRLVSTTSSSSRWPQQAR